jgi:hypothetical protein
MSRPSQSDGRTRFSAEQNRLRHLSRRTLASFMFFSAPSRAPQRRLRATERRRRERARGAARAPRRCARSDQISSPTQIQRRCADEILGLTTRRRAVVGFYPRILQIHDPWICGRRWPRGDPGKTLLLSPFFSFFLSSFLSFFFYPGHRKAA